MTSEPHACVNGHDREFGEVLHIIPRGDGTRVATCCDCYCLGGLLPCP